MGGQTLVARSCEVSLERCTAVWLPAWREGSSVKKHPLLYLKTEAFDRHPIQPCGAVETDPQVLFSQPFVDPAATFLFCLFSPRILFL